MSADDYVIKRAVRGDSDAFEEVMRRYEKLVYSIAYNMFFNVEDAKDMHQETWVKIYANIDKCHDIKHFKSWVCRIATNTCIDEWRRRKGKQPESLDAANIIALRADLPSPEEQALKNEEIAVIKNAIDALSTEDRVLITLRDIQGLSYAEIALATGVTLGTVKSGLWRARARLRELCVADHEN